MTENDDEPHGRVFSRLPFTNDEAFRAMALIYPADSLDAFRREVDLPPDEPTPMNIMGENVLLVFAAMSAEYADRILARWPDLKAEVARVRANPEAFIESERKQVFEYLERERPDAP